MALRAIQAAPAAVRVSAQRRVAVVAAARPIRHEAAALGLAFGLLGLAQPALAIQAETGADYEQELLSIIEARTHKEQALPDLVQSPALAAVEKAAAKAPAVEAGEPLAALSPDERTKVIRAEALRESKAAVETATSKAKRGSAAAPASGSTNGAVLLLALVAVGGGAAAYAQNAQQNQAAGDAPNTPREPTPAVDTPREGTPAPL